MIEKVDFWTRSHLKDTTTIRLFECPKCKKKTRVMYFHNKFLTINKQAIARRANSLLSRDCMCHLCYMKLKKEARNK